MASLPLVAIVGRANAGKSSLFNRILKERISITDAQSGTTRDRLYGVAEWLTRYFILIDTGGLEVDCVDQMNMAIQIQAEIAIAEADVILYLHDANYSVIDLDLKIIRNLQKANKPIVFALNKWDQVQKERELVVHNYYELGLGEPIIISTLHGVGIGDLLDAIVQQLQVVTKHERRDDTFVISIVGQPNVGKSSLVNAILAENRVVVSEQAGTTTTAISSFFAYKEAKYMIVDTAGIRKKKQIYAQVEKYSVIQALKSISKSDLVLLLLDCTKPLSRQDIAIAGIAEQQQKTVFFIINKWDLKTKAEHFRDQRFTELRRRFQFLKYFHHITFSSLQKPQIPKLFQNISLIKEQLTTQIATNVLNEIIVKAQLTNPPSEYNQGVLKIYYVTQVKTNPPTFVFFVNNPIFLHFSYQRYLENQMRHVFGFNYIPIHLIFRKRA